MSSVPGPVQGALLAQPPRRLRPSRFLLLLLLLLLLPLPLLQRRRRPLLCCMPLLCCGGGAGRWHAQPPLQVGPGVLQHAGREEGLRALPAAAPRAAAPRAAAAAAVAPAAAACSVRGAGPSRSSSLNAFRVPPRPKPQQPTCARPKRPHPRLYAPTSAPGVVPLELLAAPSAAPPSAGRRAPAPSPPVGPALLLELLLLRRVGPAGGRRPPLLLLLLRGLEGRGAWRASGRRRAPVLLRRVGLLRGRRAPLVLLLPAGQPGLLLLLEGWRRGPAVRRAGHIRLLRQLRGRQARGRASRLLRRS